jgi:hypothetical protein
VLGAFLLRLFWWLWQAPIISLDASEYLCVARNLIRGLSLVGCWGIPATMYNPLYSILISGIWVSIR